MSWKRGVIVSKKHFVNIVRGLMMNIDKILYLIEEENNYLIKKSFFKLS